LVPKVDLVLPEMLSDFEMWVVEYDHSEEKWSDNPFIHTRSILYEKVYFLDLFGEYLQHQEESLCSIWVLVPADLNPEAAV